MTIRPADDWYPTPPRATRALLSVEAFGGRIWEPCAGRGDMADALRMAGHDVHASTILSGSPNIIGGADFLQADKLEAPNVVTNPPFKIAEPIIRRALDLGAVKVAMLLNVKFLGGQARKDGLFATHPPARVWVFADRISMYPGDYQGKRGTTTETLAWFVWEWPHNRAPVIGWLNSKEHEAITKGEAAA